MLNLLSLIVFQISFKQHFISYLMILFTQVPLIFSLILSIFIHFLHVWNLLNRTSYQFHLNLNHHFQTYYPFLVKNLPMWHLSYQDFTFYSVLLNVFISVFLLLVILFIFSTLAFQFQYQLLIIHLMLILHSMIKLFIKVHNLNYLVKPI